jgi:hypothetical protein
VAACQLGGSITDTEETHMQSVKNLSWFVAGAVTALMLPAPFPATPIVSPTTAPKPVAVKVSAKPAKKPASKKSSTKQKIASAKKKSKSGSKLASAAQLGAIKASFSDGTGAQFSPAQMVGAGVFKSAPLKSNVRSRRKPIQYLVLHSTETEKPANALRIVRSWNNRRPHNPGTQYIVDRDGTIYQTTNPERVTMHVNDYRTKYGVNNDNSIGIEIVRSGDQIYTAKQLRSVTKLSVYLQKRYKIADEQVVSHSYVQPHNRLDPVGFDWARYEKAKDTLEQLAKTKFVQTQPTTRTANKF